MGNDVKRPNPLSLKNQLAFAEIQKCRVARLRDAAVFWKQQRAILARISKTEFDEMFGCVFADPDIVYEMFGKRTAVVLDCLSIITLFCADSVEPKIHLLYDIYAEDFKLDSTNALAKLFAGIFGGVQCIFGLEPPSKDTLLDYITNALRIQNSTKSVSALDNGDTDDVSMSLPELIQILQEDRYFPQYIDYLLSFCSTRQSITDATLAAARTTVESKLLLLSEEEAIHKKKRHPLWRFTILDLFEDSWLQHLPAMDVGDTVLSVLEHYVLSGAIALPVTSKALASGQAVARKDTELHHANSTLTNILKSLTAQEADRSESKSTSEQTGSNFVFTLVDIADMRTFTCWLASVCPSSVVNSKQLLKVNDGFLRINRAKKGKRSVLVTDKGPVVQYVRAATGSLAAIPSAAKVRRQSTLPIQEQMQEAGELFATAPIKSGIFWGTFIYLFSSERIVE